MVPTFSILFKQVTGELITSLDEEGGGKAQSENSVRTVTPDHVPTGSFRPIR